MQDLKIHKVYQLKSAINIIRSFSSKHFDETVELNVKLNLNSGKKNVFLKMNFYYHIILKKINLKLLYLLKIQK